MKQRLSILIRSGCNLGNAVFPLKTKRGVRTKAMKKAWITRKRMQQARSSPCSGTYGCETDKTNHMPASFNSGGR